VLARRARLAVRDIPVQSDAHAAGDHPPRRAGLGANACTRPHPGDRSSDPRWHRCIDDDWLDHRCADERNDSRYDSRYDGYDGHPRYSDTDRPARNESGAGSTRRSVQSSAGYPRRGHDDGRTSADSCADDDEATSGARRDNVAADDGGDDARHHTTADHTRADHHGSADDHCGSAARNDGSADDDCARTAATASRATASTGSAARSRARAT